jgi:hypothetical protein
VKLYNVTAEYEGSLAGDKYQVRMHAYARDLNHVQILVDQRFGAGTRVLSVVETGDSGIVFYDPRD